MNVPLLKEIVDTTRIDKIIPTLNFLVKKAKVIIISHMVTEKIVKELSLKPIIKH